MIAFDSDSGKGSGSLFRESPRFTDSTEKSFEEWDLVDGGRYDASNKRRGIIEEQLKSSSTWAGTGKNLTKAEKEIMWSSARDNPNPWYTDNSNPSELEQDFGEMKRLGHRVRTEGQNGREVWENQKAWISEKYGSTPVSQATWQPEWLAFAADDDFNPSDESQDFDEEGLATPLHFSNQIKRIPMLYQPTAKRILQIAYNVGQGMAAGTIVPFWNFGYKLEDFVRFEPSTNPPTGIVEWDSKVQAFAEQYDEWKSLNISQDWLSYARAFFTNDEIPMLEKGRLLLEAMDKYTLSREEEMVVKREYSSITPDVGDTQSSILSGLYDELSEEEEEEEYEDDLSIE